jgi:hypothetical protein
MMASRVISEFVPRVGCGASTVQRSTATLPFFYGYGASTLHEFLQGLRVLINIAIQSRNADW